MISDLLNHCLNRAFRLMPSRSRRSAARYRSRQAAIECLEPRQLLTAPLTGTNAAPAAETGTIASLENYIFNLAFDVPADSPAYGAFKLDVAPGNYYRDPNNSTTTAEYLVRPYFVNVGLTSLLESKGSDLSAQQVQRVGQWIQWYLNNTASDGTILDPWYRNDGSVGSLNTSPSDADDSNGTTFASLVLDFIQAGGHVSVLQTSGNKERLESILDQVLTLQQADGLTWAKQDYHVKFMMDNCEVFAGIQAMGYLEESIYGDVERSNVYFAAAERVRSGILSQLHNSETGLFRIALAEGGATTEFDANHWYPSFGILWPTLHGVLTPSLAQTVISSNQINNINQTWNGSQFPDWTMTDLEASNGKPGYLATPVGYAAVLSGRSKEGFAFADFAYNYTFQSGERNTQRLFTISDAGWLIRTLTVRDIPKRFIYVAGLRGRDEVTWRYSSENNANAVIYSVDGGVPIARTGVEAFSFNGGDGNDRFLVLAPAVAGPFPGAIFFNGSAGTNSLVVDAANSELLSPPGQILSQQGLQIGYSSTQSIDIRNAAVIGTTAGPANQIRTVAETGLTANQRFVQALYLDLLGRAGSMPELQYWVAQLSNTSGPANIASEIAGSAEARSRLIQGWYHLFLGRAASPAEIQNRIAAPKDSQTEEQSIAGILASNEFFQRFAIAHFRGRLGREICANSLQNIVPAKRFARRVTGVGQRCATRWQRVCCNAICYFGRIPDRSVRRLLRRAPASADRCRGP